MLKSCLKFDVIQAFLPGGSRALMGMHDNDMSWLTKIARFWRHHYVERQIYIRSHGQVQFISLSPLTQAIFVGIAFAFFSWIAFSSVNVVFKEQIIASKERRYIKMQGAYEERLAQIQGAYDELNGQLVIAQERFLATTRDLEEKHRQLAALMTQRQTAGTLLDKAKRRYADTARGKTNPERSNVVLMAVDQSDDGIDVVHTSTRPVREASSEPLVTGSETIEGQTINFAALAHGGRESQIGSDARIEARLSSLERAQQSLITSVEETTDKRVRELKSIIAMTKVVDPDALLKKMKSSGEGQGGPFLGLDIAGKLAGGGEDDDFEKQLFRVSKNLERMANLENAVATMPMAEPVLFYHRSSGFGARTDPFTGRRAFHSGLDMATQYGTPIHVTGSGIVTFADWKGAYGRMVEVDYGNGFKTRYGHMSQINVKVGQKVAFRDVIGKVGSSGRSSGPHVHYEIWYNGVVRNPSKFIEAGHYVFAKQG